MYDKLRAGACECICVVQHPDVSAICLREATGAVITVIFEEAYDVPACRPCADAYQAHAIQPAKAS